MVQRKALVLKDALHRSVYGAAARRDVAYLFSGQETPLSATEQCGVRCANEGGSAPFPTTLPPQKDALRL